jgi:hypothetical protein
VGCRTDEDFDKKCQIVNSQKLKLSNSNIPNQCDHLNPSWLVNSLNLKRFSAAVAADHRPFIKQARQLPFLLY